MSDRLPGPPIRGADHRSLSAISLLQTRQAVDRPALSAGGGETSSKKPPMAERVRWVAKPKSGWRAAAADGIARPGARAP
jgi:hypothetical protein